MIGIGVWVIIDGNGFANFTSTGDTSIFDYAAYAAIGLGSLIALISFCGCCGALMENKCLLGLVSCISKVAHSTDEFEIKISIFSQIKRITKRFYVLVHRIHHLFHGV